MLTTHTLSVDSLAIPLFFGSPALEAMRLSDRVVSSFDSVSGIRANA